MGSISTNKNGTKAHVTENNVKLIREGHFLLYLLAGSVIRFLFLLRIKAGGI